MKNKIMALCLTGLIAGSVSAQLDALPSDFLQHKKDLFEKALTGYGMGLVTGLIPILLPVSVMSLAGHHKNDTEALCFLGTFTAGMVTGLAVWYSAISYWIR